MDYINAQLAAHGYPEIQLDGLSGDCVDCISKCLTAMLGQRVSDMAQTEELSTKLRTLSYDHERLMGMHRSSTEKVLAAEREVNMYKSRLAAAARSLQSSESSHKQTSAELQRTRTSLQALRATHTAEIKKKEKEVERVIEKWSKLADSQTKSSPGIIFRGANADVVSGSELLGKGKGFLEVALEHAETSRTSLLDETTRLRRLVLVSANRLQSMMHDIRVLASIKSEEHVPFDHDALFPLTPINAADDKILSLFASAKDAISALSKQFSDNLNATQSTSSQSSGVGSEECKRLQAVIDKLQSELDRSKELHQTREAETRELLNQLATQQTQRAAIDDLVIASEHDAEHDRLFRIKKELEDEREKFSQAVAKLGKDKSAFEIERHQFLEEKRTWQVQQMLSEQPPSLTPEAPPPDVPPSPSLAAYLPEAIKSPRKSPRKQKVVGKSGNARKTRISRRSSIFSIPPPTNVEPAYETEVVPIVIPASKEQTNNKSSVLTKSILPTSFVLPPPSPRTSLPPPDSLLEPLDSHLPENGPDSSSLSTPEPSPFLIPTIVEPTPEPAAPMEKLVPVSVPALPRTPPPPTRRPFPVAKPLASHMTHAYSPIKPSPLSRILMLADSPESSEPEPDPERVEEREQVARSRSARTPPRSPPGRAPAVGPQGDDDSPLREKKTERNAVVARTRKIKPDKADVKKRVSARERITGNGGSGGGNGSSLKGSRETEVPAAAVMGKSKTTGAGEKENREKLSRKGLPPGAVAATVGAAAPSKPATRSDHHHRASSPGIKPIDVPSKPTNRPPAKLPVGKGGARRVPIGSAEAAPLPAGRRS